MKSKKNTACTVARMQPRHHSQVIHHHHDLLQNETETPRIEGKDNNCSLWQMKPKSCWLAYTIVILDRMISAYLQMEIRVDPLRHQNAKFTSLNTNFCGNCSFR